MSCTALTIKTMPADDGVEVEGGREVEGSGSCTQPAEAMPEKSIPASGREIATSMPMSVALALIMPLPNWPATMTVTSVTSARIQLPALP